MCWFLLTIRSEFKFPSSLFLTFVLSFVLPIVAAPFAEEISISQRIPEVLLAKLVNHNDDGHVKIMNICMFLIVHNNS